MKLSFSHMEKTIYISFGINELISPFRFGRDIRSHKQPVQCPHSLTVQWWHMEGRSDFFATSWPVADKDETQCAPHRAVDIYLDKFHWSTYFPSFLFYYSQTIWYCFNRYDSCVQDSQSALKGCGNVYQLHLFWLLLLKYCLDSQQSSFSTFLTSKLTLKWVTALSLLLQAQIELSLLGCGRLLFTDIWQTVDCDSYVHV